MKGKDIVGCALDGVGHRSNGVAAAEETRSKSHQGAPADHLGFVVNEDGNGCSRLPGSSRSCLDKPISKTN